MRKTLLRFALWFAVFALAGGVAMAQQPSQPPATAKSSSAPSASKAPSGAQSAPGTTGALGTEKQKDSYALGMNIGRGLSKQPVDLDTATFMQGLRDALMGGKTLLTDEQMQAALTELQKEMHDKQAAADAALGDKNMKEGADFLAANKTKDGVVTTASGLQYKILTAGAGPKPGASDTVVCQYRGTFIDGKEFDSSYKRGQPATFPVSGVIKGWTEALQLMPVGSKWQLFVPPDLAYGSRGAGGVIGPNATLVFEVELVSIQPK